MIVIFLLVSSVHFGRKPNRKRVYVPLNRTSQNHYVSEPNRTGTGQNHTLREISVVGLDRQRLRSASRHQLMVPRHRRSTLLLVVGLSPLRVRWNGTRFHTHTGTLLGVPTASDRLWKLIFLRRIGTISALEALRDALYKSTTTTTTRPTAI